MPLILLTADRPPELLACGANQAIDQAGLFGTHVRWRFALPCPDWHVSPAVVLTTADQALYRAVREPAGPVHINCMFREPLAPTPSAGEDLRAYCAPLASWRDSAAAYTAWRRPEVRLTSDEQRRLINRINDIARGVLVVGELRNDAQAAAVCTLAEALGWPVFPDVTSGLRLCGRCPHAVAHYDQLLLSPTFRAACAPEAILHIGGRLTSKRLQQHLACRAKKLSQDGQATADYTLVAEHPGRYDPGHGVTQRLEADVTEFCTWLAPSVRDRGAAPWGDAFVTASQAASVAIDDWLARQDTLSEIAVARRVSRARPAGSVLFLGNSMPIRDMDMFGAADGPQGWVAANRGASGIDGAVATAAGYANALGRPVTAVIGDLAALHDLNSLALLRHTAAAPVILVVLNNDGGGIFSFLPIADYPELLEACCAVPHGLGFADAAALFGLAYAQPVTLQAFDRAYAEAAGRSQSTIIEVRTQRGENLEAHRALQEAIVTRIEDLLA